MGKEKMEYVADDAQFAPIVYVNKPVSDTDGDVVGFAPQVETIKCAIDNGANMIAIVADYGAGKSSVTDLLCNKLCDKPSLYPPPIRINMWDFLKEKPDTDSNGNAPDEQQANRKLIFGEVTSLTKAFLFQLANGKDEKFSGYINKCLSKNYGIISFGTNSKRIWVWSFFAIFFYSIYQVFSQQEITFIENSVGNIKNILMVIQDIAPLFFVASLILVLCGLKNACIAFSHWKMQNNRELEVSDIFDIYMTVVQKLKPKNSKKQIVIIEDLDRITEKSVIIGFLKELYRFENICKNNKRKKARGELVFIVSLKPEAMLKDVETTSNIDDEQVYSKIFDATFSLKPVHFEDYDAILLMLIKSDTKKQKELERLIGETITDVLPESFQWIKRGTNLTLRILKDRLNQAISIMVSLKNKHYQVKSAISFRACAAAAYLENQYPKEYYSLIQQEKRFGEVISRSYGIKNDKTLNYEGKCNDLIEIIKSYDDKTAQTDSKPSESLKFTDEFLNALSELIISGVFDDDFRMYFYTYPQGSHIKTTEEKEVYNFLLLPTQYTDYSKLEETVNKVYAQGDRNIITQTISRLKTYPIVILKNDILLRIAFEKSADEAYNTFLSAYIKTMIKGVFNAEECTEVLMRLKRIKTPQKQYFIDKVCKGVIAAAEDSQEVIAFRKCVLKAYNEASTEFKRLFYTEEKLLPQITTEEIEILDNTDTAIKLINIDNLSAENFLYIPILLNGENRHDNTIYDKAVSIYLKYMEILEDNMLAPKVLEFLSVNNTIQVEFFRIITNMITDKTAISSYLNKLECRDLPQPYIDRIDVYGFDEGLSEDILCLLAEKQKYYSLLLCRAKTGSLDKIVFEDENVLQQVISVCPKINKGNNAVLIEIRKHVYNNINSDKCMPLFKGEYPLVTKEEYMNAPSTSAAIQLVNTALDFQQRVTELCTLLALREYSAEDTLLLFRQLFDESFSAECIKDQTTIRELVWNMDYTKIKVDQLNVEQSEEIAKILSAAANLRNAEDALRFLNLTKCLIPSLELIIEGDSSYFEEYLSLIKTLDTCTQTTVEWFEALPMNQLGEEIKDGGLSKNICSLLKANKKYYAYVLGEILREKNMIMDSDVPFEVYYELYTKVEAVYDIMSDHWEFLEQIQLHDLFKELDARHLQPIYKVKQHRKFFTYVLSETSEENIKEYILKFGEIETEAASKEFEKLVCTPEILELIDSKKAFEHIRERLWGDARHKMLFTRKWNERWKKELEDKELVLM